MRGPVGMAMPLVGALAFALAACGGEPTAEEIAAMTPEQRAAYERSQLEAEAERIIDRADARADELDQQARDLHRQADRLAEEADEMRARADVEATKVTENTVR